MGSKSSILKTLLYSDIFDYPLKREEIWRYLISERQIDLSEIELQLGRIGNVSFRNGFYFLRGRGELVDKRKRREKFSLPKLKKAKDIINKLFLIPTIGLIGISGNLPLKNAEEQDDIDLFIITKSNTIWITRLLVVALLKILGVYRKRGEERVKDKICTNMFLDEDNLEFAGKRKNLFTAHELTQLMPIADRDDTYKKLVLSNKWILDYLPNLSGELLSDNSKKKKNKRKASGILAAINHIVKFPQILYMEKHQTKEEISDKMLAFHPQSHEDYVLKQYQEKLQKYSL